MEGRGPSRPNKHFEGRGPFYPFQVFEIAQRVTHVVLWHHQFAANLF